MAQEMAAKPRVTVKPANPRGDLRLSDAARLEAQRALIASPGLEVQLRRLTRWAALGTRSGGAFAALVLPGGVRLIALHAPRLESPLSEIMPSDTKPLESAPRGLPKRLEWLMPGAVWQSRARSDLEMTRELLGLSRTPGFFASAPLRHGGFTLGALCVVDGQPRSLDTHAQELLSELAQSLEVAGSLRLEPEPPTDLRQDNTQQDILERSRVRALGAMLPVLLIGLDARGIIRHAEGQVLRDLKRPAERLIGRSAFAVFETNPQILQAITRGLGGETLQATLAWERRVFHVWLVPARNGARLDGLSALALDISDFQNVNAHQLERSRP
jgi:hypothetical protein